MALAIAQEKLSELQKRLFKLKYDFDKKMEEKEQLVKKVSTYNIVNLNISIYN